MQYPKLREDELFKYGPDKEDCRLDELDALGERGYHLLRLARTWLSLEKARDYLPPHNTTEEELDARVAVCSALEFQKARIEAEMLPDLDKFPESAIKADIASHIIAEDLRGTPFAKALLESAARDIQNFDGRGPGAPSREAA